MNSVSRSSGQRGPGEHLAHPGAPQAERDELVRHVRDRRDRHDRRPAAHGAHAEQAERLAHRADGPRQREEGGVDVAQQLEREADVGGDDPLEVLERDVAGGQLAEAAQRAEARRGHAAMAEQARLGEVVALEVREALALQALEAGVVRDAGGDQQRALHPRRLEHGGQLLLGAVGDVDLDDRAQRHERLDVVAPVVVAERQRVAGARERLEQRRAGRPGPGRRRSGARRGRGGPAAGRSRPGSCGRSTPRRGAGRRAARARCRRTPRPAARRCPWRRATGRRGRRRRRTSARSRRRCCARQRSDGGRRRPRDVQRRRCSHLQCRPLGGMVEREPVWRAGNSG